MGKLREVYTFSTVETFWCLYNNILPASRLSVQSDYSLFVSGIQPTWEDEVCGWCGVKSAVVVWLFVILRCGGPGWICRAGVGVNARVVARIWICEWIRVEP